MPITATNNQGGITIQGSGLKNETHKVTTTISALTNVAGGNIAHTDGTQNSGLGVLHSTHILTSLEKATVGNDDATFSMSLTELAGQSEFEFVANREYTISTLVFKSDGTLLEQMSLEDFLFKAPPTAADLGTVSVGTGSQTITVQADGASSNVENVVIQVTGQQTTNNTVKHWIKSYTKAQIVSGVTITGTNGDVGVNGTEFVGGLIDGSRYKVVATAVNTAGTAEDREESTYTVTPSTTANKTTQVQVTTGKTLLTNGAASIDAEDIVSGSVYKITDPGNSGFAAHVGAANNDVGTVFTASANGSVNLTGTSGKVTSLASTFSASIGSTSDETLVITAKQGAQMGQFPDLHYVLRAAKTGGATYYKKYAIGDSNPDDSYVRFLISNGALMMYTNDSGAATQAEPNSTSVDFDDGTEFTFNVGSINQVTINQSADPSYADTSVAGQASGLPAQLDGQTNPIGMTFAVGKELLDANSSATIPYANQASWGQKIRLSLKKPDSNGSPILGFKFTVGGASLTKTLADLTLESVSGSSIENFYSYIATDGTEGVTLVNGTTYTITGIAAYNANGDSPVRTMSDDNLKPSTKPGVPRSVVGSPKINVKAADSNMYGKVKGTWVVPADNGGLAVTSYQYKLIRNLDDVEKSSADSNVLTKEWTADGSSIILGTGYRITVSARNDNGLSTPVTATEEGDVGVVFAPSQPPALAAAAGVQFAAGIKNTFLSGTSFFTVALGAIAEGTLSTNGGYELKNYLIEMVDIDGNGTESKTVAEGQEQNDVVFNGTDALAIQGSQYKYKMAVYPLNDVYTTKADSTPMYATLTSGGSALEIEMSTAVLSLSSAVTQDTSASADTALTFQWTLNSGAQYTNLTTQTVKVDIDTPTRAGGSDDITFPASFATSTNFSGTLDASNAPIYKATFTGLDNGWKYKCSVIPNSEQRQKSDLTNSASVTSPAATLSAATIPATKPGLTLGSATGGSSALTILNNGSSLDSCFYLAPHGDSTAVRDIGSAFTIGGDADVKYKVGGTATVPSFNRYNNNGSIIDVNYTQTLTSIPTATIGGVANTNNLLIIADNGKGATVALNGAPLNLSVS